jgi:hypothetical protein
MLQAGAGDWDARRALSIRFFLPKAAAGSFFQGGGADSAATGGRRGRPQDSLSPLSPQWL